VASRRSYGSGRLFERTNAAGKVSWYGSWWAAGTRVKRKIGEKRTPSDADGMTRSQAERELRRRIERDVIVPARARRTIEQAGSEYVDHLERVMQRKRSTVQDYRGYLRGHLAPFFGDKPIDRIDAARVAQYLRRKSGEGLSSKTVQNHLNFLHGIFSFALRRGWAAGNPVALVDRPRGQRSANQRVRFLQPHELDALLGAVPNDSLGEVQRVLYLAAALTGLRQGELIALRWLDIDCAVGRIRVAESFTRGRMDTPKSHQGRSVPMARRLAGELRALRSRSGFSADQDLVFCHPETGHVLDPSKLRKRFKTAITDAGVQAITFHELRHTFGTQIAAAGAPLRAIQEWMGHADAKTTEIYRHYAPDPTHGAAFVERAFGSGDQAP
jgi:integrase